MGSNPIRGAIIRCTIHFYTLDLLLDKCKYTQEEEEKEDRKDVDRRRKYTVSTF